MKNISFTDYYEYIDGEITPVKSIVEQHEFIEATEEGYVFIVRFTYYELVDGEMTAVDRIENIEIVP